MTLPAFPKHLEVEIPDVGTRTARAFDRLRGLPVALKWATTRMQANGLVREWQYLHRLSDRFVPPAVEFSRASEREAYLTAAWIEGQALDAYLRAADAASQVAAVLDALAGLDHLHGAGLCHRDIRTRNLLIVEGSNGPRARWLDLEHAVTEGMLEAGTSYVGGRPMGEDRGNDAFPSQDDVKSFCVVLGKVLEEVADNPAVTVLREFARRADSVFYLDEMPHARAAWTILREMVLEAGLPVPADCSALGVARWVPRVDVERTWRTLVGPGSGGPSVLLVHGPSGVGKRTFLARAVGELAAGGAHVVNLVGKGELDLTKLDLDAGAGRRPLVLVETDLKIGDDLRRSLIDAGWQVVVVGDSERELPADMWKATGASVSSWAFPSFGARDWYRWIAASV